MISRIQNGRDVTMCFNKLKQYLKTDKNRVDKTAVLIASVPFGFVSSLLGGWSSTAELLGSMVSSVVMWFLVFYLVFMLMLKISNWKYNKKVKHEN